MVTILPRYTQEARQRKPTFTEKLGLDRIAKEFGKGIGEKFEKHEDERELEKKRKAIGETTGINTKGFSEAMLEDVVKNFSSQRFKPAEKKPFDKFAENRANQKYLNGEPLTDAERDYVTPATVRSKRAEGKEPKRPLSELPIDEKQLTAKRKAHATPGYNEMNELEKYDTLIEAGVSPILAEKESKLTTSMLERQQKGLETSYKSQEDFINNTTNSYKAFETETKPRLLQLQKLATDDDLIGPTAAVFLDTMGIPLGALEDPSSELFNKVSLDLLKGLPETFGNRIMKVEVDNFLKTIPTLMNSPAGRRMVASNMLKLGEMKEVYYNEMRRQQKNALESQKPYSRDFQQNVFDQVKPQINRINNEFVKMSEIKNIPKGTIPFFNPSGDIEFVPMEHAQWALENGGKRIW